jgi:predicted amidohydrolase YtcJ
MNAHFAVVLAALRLGFGDVAVATDPPAAIVLLHGKIHSEDTRHMVAQALAINGNTIVAVGSDTAVNALVGPGTRIVDLGGRVVLPGIIDAHIHPADGARDLDTCSLGSIPTSAAALLARVTKCLRENPGDPDSWFRVIKVDPVGLSVTRGDLDAILSDRPMVIFGSGGHTVWVNSTALAAARITAATKDPAGGHIERDAKGSPTGTLQDTVFELVQRAMPKPDLNLEAAQLERAFDLMHARGITSVQDASVDDDLMQIYKRVYDTHRLTMRVRASYTLENLHGRADALIERAIAFRAKWAIDADFLRADAVKIFADGVIENPGQTAALLEPYLDAAGHPTANRGPSYFTQST